MGGTRKSPTVTRNVKAKGSHSGKAKLRPTERTGEELTPAGSSTVPRIETNRGMCETPIGEKHKFPKGVEPQNEGGYYSGKCRKDVKKPRVGKKRKEDNKGTNVLFFLWLAGERAEERRNREGVRRKKRKRKERRVERKKEERTEKGEKKRRMRTKERGNAKTGIIKQQADNENSKSRNSTETTQTAKNKDTWKERANSSQYSHEKGKNRTRTSTRRERQQQASLRPKQRQREQSNHNTTNNESITHGEGREHQTRGTRKGKHRPQAERKDTTSEATDKHHTRRREAKRGAARTKRIDRRRGASGDSAKRPETTGRITSGSDRAKDGEPPKEGNNATQKRKIKARVK